MNEAQIKKELTYTAVTSGGPGGQHANKVATKVVLQFSLFESKAFTEEEMNALRTKLESSLSGEGMLILSCDESRSQHRNKETVTRKCLELLREGTRKPKKRIPTRAGKSAKLKRLEEKKKKSHKKALRRKPDAE